MLKEIVAHVQKMKQKRKVTCNRYVTRFKPCVPTFTMWFGVFLLSRIFLSRFSFWHRVNALQGALRSSVWRTDGKAGPWWLAGRKEERLEQKEREKERRKRTCTLKTNTSARDPSESVCVSQKCVLDCWVVSLCVFLSAPLARSGVWDDEVSLSSAGHDADVQTVALCFSSFNKPLMETPPGLAVDPAVLTEADCGR